MLNVNVGDEMSCTAPGFMRHPTTRLWVSYPCGQCLPCRIRRKSAWTCRCLLESATSSSVSFWTMTLDEHGLRAWDDLGPRQMARDFFARLRKAEVRRGNASSIRYFGCSEYGERTGRPHFHFIIFNLGQTWPVGTEYMKGYRRPLHLISVWPFGHVDIGQPLPAAFAYVSGYMLKGSGETRLYKSVRPGIGSFGIELLAEKAAQMHTTLSGPPDFLELGGRRFPLDNFLRERFRRAYVQAGGELHEEVGGLVSVMERICIRNALRENPELAEPDARKVMWKERSFEKAAREKEINGSWDENERPFPYKRVADYISGEIALGYLARGEGRPTPA